jgi:hypothetical protein
MVAFLWRRGGYISAVGGLLHRPGLALSYKFRSRWRRCAFLAGEYGRNICRNNIRSFRQNSGETKAATNKLKMEILYGCTHMTCNEESCDRNSQLLWVRITAGEKEKTQDCGSS